MSARAKKNMSSGRLNGQIFMVGTGGQGILLLARALAQIAVNGGRPVISSETHGMAMRGGTVTANLKIGEYASPLIPSGSADLLIGLDDTEARGYLHMLGPKGVSIMNSREKGVFGHVIDATGMALESGMPGAVNMIMLGFAAGVLGVPEDEALNVTREISPSRGLEDNLKALEMGYGHIE
jgi:indolepyruvate ferredoxin oxidoreductase, beta subunit